MSLVDDLLKAYDLQIALLEIVPSSGGVFEVVLDGELIFSKTALGRHAHAHEIFDLVQARLGDPALPDP